MPETTDHWRSIPTGPGIPEGMEVNEADGSVRIRRPDSPEDDGSSGDREPRDPKIPPFAGAATLEHVPVDVPLD